MILSEVRPLRCQKLNNFDDKTQFFRLTSDSKEVWPLTSFIFRCAKILKKNGEFYKKQQGFFAKNLVKTPFLLIFAFDILIVLA